MNLKKAFESYLKDEVSVSTNSLRFYRSDFNHFANWLIREIKKMSIYVETFEETLPYLTSDFANRYKDFLKQKKSPKATINRKLSALRHLGRFLLQVGMLDFDFMKETNNVGTTKPKQTSKSPYSSLSKGFQNHLEGEDISKNTVKNYLSDIKHFLEWLESQNV